MGPVGLLELGGCCASSGNRFQRSPWLTRGTHLSHGKTQISCSPCHSCSCTHSEKDSHWRCGDTCERGSIGWCTLFHRYQAASGDSPKTGKIGRWEWGRHTHLLKKKKGKLIAAHVWETSEDRHVQWCNGMLYNCIANS